MQRPVVVTNAESSGFARLVEQFLVFVPTDVAESSDAISRKLLDDTMKIQRLRSHVFHLSQESTARIVTGVSGAPQIKYGRVVAREETKVDPMIALRHE